MDIVNLEKALMQIARENPEGFTVYLHNLQPVRSGWSVGLKETQNSHGLEGLRNALIVSRQRTGFIGGWNADGKFWWDAVQIFEDEQQATEFGIENGQIAIYQIETNRLKFL